MEKSLLREAPYQVGRWRLFDQLNSHAGPFSHVCRLADPEAARLRLHDTPGVTVEAWHQTGAELAALYSWNGAWILFDRFAATEGTDTVVAISASTLELQLMADTWLLTTQSGDDDPWASVVNGE